MRDVIIRPQTPDDEAEVEEVNRRAFGRQDEARLVARLQRADEASISLVAERDGRVVGHILFSPVNVEGLPDDLRAVGLAPMAVLPEHQRQGIGGRLVEAGLAACRQAGFAAVVVLGYPEYYPKFGFVPASTRRLRCAYDAPDEAFMVLELRAGALSGVSGLVRYSPAFVDLET